MFVKEVKLVTPFDSDYPMQAHPEFPIPGFQYRENTVSLYPMPSYFFPTIQETKDILVQILW